MSKIKIVYWSGTGNTEEMAGFLEDGVRNAGKEAEILPVSSASLDDLKEDLVFALGCPSMGDEELEDGEMEPFVAEVISFAKGKKIVLFGSYGWGSGEWMRDWEQRMKDAGAEIIGGEGFIAMDTPDQTAAEELKNLGKKMAELIS